MALICVCVQEGIAITDPSMYRSISREQLVHVLRPDSPGSCMPLVDDRLESLHSAGTTLCQVDFFLADDEVHYTKTVPSEFYDLYLAVYFSISPYVVSV